jgi:AraC-like DNA-binding protein
MQFKKIQAPAHLRDHVRFFWTLEGHADVSSPGVLGPLADGCPGMIFQPTRLGVFHDEFNKKLPGVFLYGQTLKRTALYMTGQFKSIGICFQPESLHTVFGFSADELTEECLDINLLSSAKTNQLEERLENSLSLSKRVNILADYLSREIGINNTKIDPSIKHALIQVTRTNGKIPLRDLRNDLNLSERSFERKFNFYVGISPKVFSNVCRFQASLNQLKENRYSRLSDVAFDNGYADQSHFIRSFKEFAGFSPYQFQKQSREIHANISAPITE